MFYTLQNLRTNLGFSPHSATINIGFTLTRSVNQQLHQASRTGGYFQNACQGLFR
jgi:hypothetical protein